MTSWRDVVGRAPVDDRTPLALGVELRQRDAYDPGRWEPRAVSTVTPRSLAARDDSLLLCVRPLVPGAGGSWIRGDVSWDDVRRRPERYRAAHARWFAELHSIAHDVRATGPFASVAEWLVLDDAVSSLLWPHLAGAAALAIPVVATSRQQQVEMASSSTVEVVLTAGDAGGLRLAPRVRIPHTDDDVDAASVRPIGRTGIYAFARDRDPITLTLAPATLDDTAAALLRSGPVEVPGDESAEFLRDAYPRLARSGELVVRGVRVPDLRTPTARLSAEFDDAGRTRYRLEWTYPGVTPVAWDAEGPASRDPRAERAIAARVEHAWSEASALPFAPAASLTDDDALEFALRILPALERVDGVRIETRGDRPAPRELSGEPMIRVTTVETDDPDWFDLGIFVTIEGRPVPFGPLLTALTRGRRRMRLADGAYFALSHPALARLKELLDEAAALDEWETGARIARTQTTLWADFEDLAEQSEPAVAWRALLGGLRDVESVAPAPLPAGLHAQLRPYQRSGYDWLMFLRQHRLGGILADDMGLGKTVQTLAFLAATVEGAAAEGRAPTPFLVVAPTSVLPSWQEQAARFTPGLVVRTVEATSARRGTPLADIADDADVVLTSYAVLRLDETEYADREWAGLILDEAQFVKNPATKLHRAVAGLRAGTTIAITGTPLENSLTDLWALLSLTAPGLFPSARRFRDEYVQPIEQGRVPENTEGGPYRTARLARLRHRIRPLVLRRTKDRVARDLPPKQEQDLHVELSAAHRELYDTVLHRERQKVLGLLDDLDRNRFIVFRSLTLLRLLSLAPALVDEKHRDLGSAKLDALIDHLVELAAEGHRALVFSQFTSFLDLVQARLDALGVAYSRLDGSTVRRGEVIDGFRSGDAPVFLLSLKAGGTGLTLTEADYVFLMDPWWSPAAEAQAIDRTHRIGQQRSVFVYRLIAHATIEEKVRDLQQRKARLFRAVMDDDDLFARSLTADDVRALLGE